MDYSSAKVQDWYSYDPYDLWATPLGIKVRRKFYEDKVYAKILAACFVGVDWAFEKQLRKIIKIPKIISPITAAHIIKLLNLKSELRETYNSWLHLLGNLENKEEKGWGLGFPWMSKNGFYTADTPFITHTPYVMEALLVLMDLVGSDSKAEELFKNSWFFLESLKCKLETDQYLALSYAPIDEPRIVINANSYACWAFSMHGSRGELSIRDLAMKKSIRLAKWIIKNQRQDGSWLYYADDKKGNFIDTFHSCFILKNLIKASELNRDLKPICDFAISKGWDFVESHLVDLKTGLCKRFFLSDFRDLYEWDLYDQAEYLGLLIQQGMYKKAKIFKEKVRRLFFRKSNWWVKIDYFGKLHGENFLRWGVAPFLYYEELLNKH